ncbi:jg23984 [Pararge aegeria aegeria]|uniref:Jg23984 protein n=1 Tax=Pararge aegeria aegeria TaxID=348720 RepID=A0A8S4QJ80_9NEOP|nr:jg23984 [Pararge aegeria aegeria]
MNQPLDRTNKPEFTRINLHYSNYSPYSLLAPALLKIVVWVKLQPHGYQLLALASIRSQARAARLAWAGDNYISGERI